MTAAPAIRSRQSFQQLMVIDSTKSSSEFPERDVMITANVPIRRFVSIMALSFIVGACGRIPGQFEILNNQVPLDGCVIPTNQTVYQGQGRLDLSLVSASATSAYL